jgi:hypothetical protein
LLALMVVKKEGKKNIHPPLCAMHTHTYI